MTKKLRIDIPVKLAGDPAGVTQQGGILEHITRSITVECLPTDIVESFALDISGLNIGDSLLVANLQIDKSKYVVLSSSELAIAKVSAPKAEEEVVVAAVEGAVGEPEVITEKKLEGEEGEEGAEEGDGKKDGKKEAKGEKKEAGKPEGKKEAGKPEGKKEESKKGK